MGSVVWGGEWERDLSPGRAHSPVFERAAAALGAGGVAGDLPRLRGLSQALSLSLSLSLHECFGLSVHGVGMRWRAVFFGCRRCFGPPNRCHFAREQN